MATINGTINSVHFMSDSFSGHGAEKVYLLGVSVPVYDASADTLTITGVGAAINLHTRDGATLTLRAGFAGYAGQDTNDQAVYATGASVHALTISTDDFTGELSDIAGTEIDATASSGMGVFAVVSVA